VVGAVLQSIQFFNDEDILAQSGVHPLNWDVQQFIVSEWLNHQNLLGTGAVLIKQYTDLFNKLQEIQENR
jgi:hypothetical protein